MRRPTLDERRAARAAARDAWIEAAGDPERAKAIFEADHRMQSIDPATLFLLIQLALKLWLWWKEQNTDLPSVVASMSEPGLWEDDDIGS